MEMNHVLVVEDDKEIREGVEIYLKSQGYEVFQAADGIEGLEVIEKEEIHLAIVDIMMPRMDGLRMTMKLREKYGSRMAFKGGIDKYVLREDFAAIDQELAYKMSAPLLGGGTIFAIDHRIPNGVSLANYRHYVEEGRKRLGLPPVEGEGWARMGF